MATKQAPVSSLKSHLCSKCTRSFATRKALAEHSRAMGHGFPCTVSGCKRTFLSTAALQAHLSSSVHFSPAPTTTRTSPASGSGLHSVLGNQGLQSFKCTVSGCGKVFATSHSRRQHLDSLTHKESSQPKGKFVVKSEEVQIGFRTGTVGERSGASSAGGVQQYAQPQVVTPMAGKTPGAQPAAALEPETPSAKSTVSPKKSVKAPKGKQKSAAVVPKVSAPILPQQATSSTRQIPLDSRWSVIPAAQYNSAMSALISCIPKTAVLPMNDSTTKSLTIAPTTAPSHSSTLQRRRAVALDCEMVRIGHNISELARLSAIDYLTGEILIDTLVRPLHAVTDWRTQWSGVTAQAMNAAVASGTALQGAPEARTQLFTFVDTETVLVGHALHHDLAALGICHQNVVDSAALASKAVAMGARKQWGLQALCAELLTLSVQGHGSQGHDSVEDALAAREVVLWSLRNPGPLKAWGKRKKMEMLEEDRLRKARRDAKRLARAPRIEYTYPDPWDYSDASGVYDVSLRELNEMCGYPVWYDNWSD